MIKPKMIPIEEGTFMMGSEEGYEDEKPIHPVTLSSFYLGQFTVTQKEWEAIMDSNPSVIKGNELPITNISWYDVQKFIQKLNALTSLRYRLPTEAEWEFAARGGIRSKGYKYSGSNDLNEVAWYSINSNDEPHLVGKKKANELGIYDMCGNVREWCQDWYGEYSSSAQTNPIGPNTGSYRIYRGGSWVFAPHDCRVTSRDSDSPGNRGHGLGFRLAHDFETFINE